MMHTLLAMEWSLGIGDPTVIGWVVCVAYAVTAWKCLAAAARANAARAESLTRFWVACAFVLTLLAFNKQLDLQKLVTQVLRATAREQGWYRDRKPVQVAAMAVAFIGAGALACWVLFVLRAHRRSVGLALGGFLVIAAYLAMRAVSLHAVDEFLGAGSIPLRHAMELIGLALVYWASILRPRQPTRTP